MSRKTIGLVCLLITLLSLGGCRTAGRNAGPGANSDTGPAVGMANPAAVYCEGLGYESENVINEAGEDADCIFPDGSRCGQWDFLSGRCGQQFSYCTQNGGTLEESGNIGTCRFSDGSSCSEFDFFENRCQPGESAGD